MSLVPGVRPILDIGGRVFTDLTTNLIVLNGQVDGTGVRCTMRRNFATSGYQVTAAKTLNVWAIRVNTRTAEANVFLNFAYVDSDIGISTTTAFTNAVFLGGTANASSLFNGAAVGLQEAATFVPLPAQKYFGVQTAGSSTVAQALQAFGYEV